MWLIDMYLHKITYQNFLSLFKLDHMALFLTEPTDFLLWHGSTFIQIIFTSVGTNPKCFKVWFELVLRPMVGIYAVIKIFPQFLIQLLLFKIIITVDIGEIFFILFQIFRVRPSNTINSHHNNRSISGNLISLPMTFRQNATGREKPFPE